MSKSPYTYTVLRYVHDTGTGEFANVGVVLTSPSAGYADAILRPTYGRLSKMFPGMDGDHFRSVIKHLQSRFDELSARIREEINLGDRPANALELAHRVIAPDDSSFQWSPMGSGLAKDLTATMETIYRRMVELYDEKTKSESRNDEDIWKTFRKGFEEKRILSRLHPKVIAVQDDEITFEHAWKNHQWHCLESISFDLMQPKSIKDKAHNWLGRITSVKNTKEDFRVYFLVGEPQLDTSRKAFEQALNVLQKAPVAHQIIRENEAEHFAAEMAEKIAAHDAEINA
ncbi:MAG: DUF3037 domain-containing protein [Akkermansiaceae bacterium]